MGALRLFLAYGVVLAHLRGFLIDQGTSWHADWALGVVGGASVYFFYIISGFLMSYVLESKYPRTPVGTYQFFKSRFLRIYPLWWVVAAVCAATAADWPENPFQVIGVAVLFGSDWWTFLQDLGVTDGVLFPPGSEVGWTLGAELTFYLLAPRLLRSDRVALAVLVGSAALRCLAFFFAGPVSGPDVDAYVGWSYFFAPSTIMLFLLGHFARRIPAVIIGRLWPSLVLLAAVAAMSMWAHPVGDDARSLYHFGDLFRLLTFVLFAAALPGLFEATKDNRMSNWLGDLTYPLYLTHSLTSRELNGSWPIVGTPTESLVHLAKTIEPAYLQGPVLFGFIIVTCLVVAQAVHLLVERPMGSTWRYLISVVERAIKRSRARAAGAKQAAAP